MGPVPRSIVLLAAAVAATLLASAPATPAADGPVRAGVAAVDASWHVGASAGQYASDGTFVGVHGADPTTHSYRRTASYGIQSRLQARALVVEGADGRRIALVKNDLYIPQDLLYRRTAQLLEAGDSGITRDTLTIAVTHDHSSPYYSATSWGVWAFQDVFDVRFFDYYAKRMATAVEEAAGNLKPVRVGASVTTFDKTHRHSFGPAIADDGTPAGYPHSDTDQDLSVVRFDDVSDPANPKPLANLVTYSLHPEFLEGNDLISADYVAPLQRMVDRETGALTVYTQNAVGTAEPERSTHHSMHERLEFSHREYAQAEYAARLMADAVVDTWRDVERGTPERLDRYVPFDDSLEVAMEDRWFPGPVSHPYPGVSNCRADKAFEGDPQFPVVGLPDCEGGVGVLQSLASLAGLPRPPDPPSVPIDPGLSTDDFQSRGIPLPENYSAPSYTGLAEDVSVHLQAFRLGEILFTVCSCEQWKDQSYNIKTRTDLAQGNDYHGYDWASRCTYDGDPAGTWTCPDPRNPATALPPIAAQEFARMKAQVNNDATGWNDLSNILWAESEPTDPAQIKGNYAHEELPPALGYRLTVPISMANDYNGYIASYREYQRGDHYRKALTGWGPHSSDYMSSRLVALGGHLKGGPDLPAEVGQEKVPVDLALNDQRADKLGEIGETSVSAYEATLPNDGGPAAAVEQPQDIERFSAAFFKWNGGSNFTDNPHVKVQQRTDTAWVDYAGQSGEIPVTVEFPQGQDTQSYLEGGHQWRWTAHFEAFAANFSTIEGVRATPTGTYRFVVDGMRREGGRAVPYRLRSQAFEVRRWDGITVDTIAADATGRVTFAVGPRRTLTLSSGGPPVEAVIGPIDYPDSYSSPARFIEDTRQAFRDPAAPADPAKLEWYCFRCSFRPWADTGVPEVAYVTIVRRDGSAERVRARERASGSFYVSRQLKRGERAYVAAGDVIDAFGNVNGEQSNTVLRP
jgi:Neutral/alkaline non-lysosomal ceramidase, N-terminal